MFEEHPILEGMYTTYDAPLALSAYYMTPNDEAIFKTWDPCIPVVCGGQGTCCAHPRVSGIDDKKSVMFAPSP